MSDKKIELYLIRHGKTQGNKEHRFIGVGTDSPLCTEGVDMLNEKRCQNEYPKVDMCFSSPMKRCLETASVIYPEHEVIVIDELREIDFGDFEGHNHEELDGDPKYQEWIDSGGKLAFPNGEGMDEYGKMVAVGLNKLKEIAIQSHVTKVAATVHGGTVMAACSYLGISDYFDGIIGNGEIMKVIF